MAEQPQLKPYKKFKYTVKKVIQNPEALHPSMILKIGDMPNANERIVQEVSKFYDLSLTHSNEIINFMGGYIYNIIRAGMMETVMLPHFGKFAPNMKMLQAKVKRIRGIRNGKYMLELALKGKNINFRPQVNPITYDTSYLQRDGTIQKVPEEIEEQLEPESISGQEIYDNLPDDDLGDDSWNLDEVEEDEV